jgi:hypothetical protein
VVSRPLFLLMLRAMRVGARRLERVRKLLGAGESPKLEALRTAAAGPDILVLHGAALRVPQRPLQALARRFVSEDRARFSVDTGAIDWQDYLCRIHMTGLNRYALRRALARSRAAAVPSRSISSSTHIKNNEQERHGGQQQQQSTQPQRQ